MRLVSRPCETGPDVRIDLAVVRTPGAREAYGTAAAIEVAIDLWVAEATPSGPHR